MGTGGSDSPLSGSASPTHSGLGARGIGPLATAGIEPVQWDLIDAIAARHRRIRLRAFAGSLDGIPGPLLDLGGQHAPYRAMFRSRVCINLDIDPSVPASVVGDGRCLPFRENVFAGVLCSQVIEHTTEPAVMVREIHRVLMPGGRLFLSAPSVYMVHGSPGDYWRFLPDGLRHLMRDFAIVDIQPEGWTFSSPFQIANMFLHVGMYPATRLHGLLRLLYRVSNLLGHLADRLLATRFRTVAQQFCVNYNVVATKREG